MNYLLIAATAMEIGPFLDNLRQTNKPAVAVDVLITGVGLVATTHALSTQLALRKPDLIIQAGIAGSFKPEFSPGMVCVVAQDVIADQGVLEKKVWLSTTDMGFTPLNKSPYKNGWLKNPDAKNYKKNKLPVVPAISVNQITTSKQTIGLFREKYAPTLESMEGAALHYTALLASIPFIQLRAVSNYVGDRNKKNWDIKNAVINLNKELLHLLPIL